MAIQRRASFLPAGATWGDGKAYKEITRQLVTDVSLGGRQPCEPFLLFWKSQRQALVEHLWYSRRRANSSDLISIPPMMLTQAVFLPFWRWGNEKPQPSVQSRQNLKQTSLIPNPGSEPLWGLAECQKAYALQQINFQCFLSCLNRVSAWIIG